MTKYLLLHGWGGSDFPHWQSWLASELAKDYGCVSFLRFSDPDMPRLDQWSEELQEHLAEFKPDVIICHSLANTLWFHLCNTNPPKEIQKLFLVAPPRIDSKIEELSSFFPITLPKDLCAKETLLITSTNDPYLSTDEANKMQEALDVEMKVILNGGHINADSGFGAWEWILHECKNPIQGTS
ncbi:MAG: alpha/beta hydrolase [Helicobacteraceae bacterium]|nr:alpha/beta hydrolase [Helicobacteraceae bacterium]